MALVRSRTRDSPHNRHMSAREGAPARPAHPRSPLGVLLVLAGVCVAAFLLHVGSGSADPGAYFRWRLSPGEVLAELFRGQLTPGLSQDNLIVWQIRLPRALACLLVGGLLGSVGSAFQALFKNPLADPYIVGVSSGAAVGGALALVLGIAGWAGGLGLMLACFVCGLGALGLVFGLARSRGALDVQRLLLAGVVIGSMLSAVLSMVLLASGLDTNQVLRWLLGSATPMYWNRITALALAFVVGGAVLLAQTKRLNALAMGEEAARRLGVNTRVLVPTVLAVGTAMTAVTVGSVGIIGFLGLVAPHIARRIVGVDWRWSLLASALCGMALLVLSDIAAQRLIPGAELQLGIITALLGAPFLLVLLRRSPE